MAAIAATAAGVAAVAAGPALAGTAGVDTSAPQVVSFPHSLFDQPVTSWPVAPLSGVMVSALVSEYHDHYGGVGVNETPVFVVGPSQAPVRVHATPGCSNFLSGTGSGIPIPPGAYTSAGSDHDLIVEQPSSGQIWELWRAYPDLFGGWTACWGGSINSETSSGVFPYPLGLSASGISYAATTITEADVASGHIDHAIAMQIDECNRSVAPANRTDCPAEAGQPSEGMWFRLPAATPEPAGLTPFGQMVFTALKNYGAVVVDRAGAVMVEAEDTRDWRFSGRTGLDPLTDSWAGQPEYRALAGIPWQSLQQILPSSS